MENDKEKWAENQLNEEQAIKLFESKVWESWSDEEIVRFQLFQKRLGVNFGRFQNAMNTVLGRSVFTHEYAFRENLVLEYLGEKQTPTLEEIIDLIPKEKRVLIGI